MGRHASIHTTMAPFVSKNKQFVTDWLDATLRAHHATGPVITEILLGRMASGGVSARHLPYN